MSKREKGADIVRERKSGAMCEKIHVERQKIINLVVVIEKMQILEISYMYHS